jgi:hypothetical protein
LRGAQVEHGREQKRKRAIKDDNKKVATLKYGYGQLGQSDGAATKQPMREGKPFRARA